MENHENVIVMDKSWKFILVEVQKASNDPHSNPKYRLLYSFIVVTMTNRTSLLKNTSNAVIMNNQVMVNGWESMKVK